MKQFIEDPTVSLKIDGVVTPLMQTIVTPFIGNAYVRVDSTSRDRIRWDDISIRPLKTVLYR